MADTVYHIGPKASVLDLEVIKCLDSKVTHVMMIDCCFLTLPHNQCTRIYTTQAPQWKYAPPHSQLCRLRRHFITVFTGTPNRLAY